MKLTFKEAQNILEISLSKINHEGLRQHVEGVSYVARTIAKNMNLDEDYAAALGLIHDIGKCYGEFANHDINGFNYINSLGYEEEAYVCLTHSYLNNDTKCLAGSILSPNTFRDELVKNHKYTIYEKIINLSDLLCGMCLMPLDERLVDIAIRRGITENTLYHIKEAHKLKKYIDEQLGFNLYDLFPEMLKNI